ncbi:MAG: hypothetical protein WAW45_00660, partial [Atribacterota bacterium]
MKNRFRKTFIFFTITLIMISFCAGCTGTEVPKTAQLSISADPNPVPCGNDGKWYYELVIKENNGIGVTINVLIFRTYDDSGKLLDEHDSSDDIKDFFKTDYVSAFSNIK